MKTLLSLLFLCLALSIAATDFNPASPNLHLLIGKPADDPLVLYYLANTGFTLDKFLNSSSETIYKGDYMVSISLLLNEGFRRAEIAHYKDSQSEQFFSELTSFYGLPSHFQDFLEAYNNNASLRDIWQYKDNATEENPEASKMVFYPKGSELDAKVKLLYQYREDGKYVIHYIAISGDFNKFPLNTWWGDADDYVQYMVTDQRQSIKDVMAKARGGIAQTSQQNNSLNAATKPPQSKPVVEEPLPDIWEPYFGSKTKSMLYLFNKKDYCSNDWKVIQEKYGFTKDDEYVKSKDQSVVIETGNYDTIIKSIGIKVTNESILKAFGFGEQMTYDELEARYGPNYIRAKSSYFFIGGPEKDPDKHHHMSIGATFNYDADKITRIGFSPLHPEDFKFDSTFGIYPTGAVDHNVMDYLWADGFWFKGILNSDLPYSGEIYSYEGTSRFTRLLTGRC